MVRSMGLALALIAAAGCTAEGTTPQKSAYYGGRVNDHFNSETFFGPYNPDGEQTGNHIGPADAVTAFRQLDATMRLACTGEHSS
ncbi:hypothetical protein D3876_04070 [Sphingomonas cavernae]|uniref:Uncharacterized protein n=1 Tax=Sphingomonas cavernae TaxID=2320861 RepID=A0A418WQI7_9SPHN|nr:hypothetical protein D3876_04070 [Sphingomonas cavernae]